MVQWEYKITGPQTDFDEIGADGWELVTIDGASMYWKRPLEAEVPKLAARAPVKDSTGSPPPTPSSPATSASSSTSPAKAG
jgi:hypothetical protein